MKSLKQLVDNYGGFMTDEQIILKYYVDNNLEAQAVEMMTKISKAKIEKLNRRLDYAQTWANVFCLNIENAQKSFGKNAGKMISLQIWYVTNIEPNGTSNEESLERADGIKEIFNIVPRIDYPKNAFFYRPCLEWLHSQGIYFKNEVKND